MSGQVIALNTAIVSPTGGSVGIGFAIPSEIASRVVEELLAKGHVDRGWLGVVVDDTEHRRAGAAIAEVTKGGPAARGGLRPGDVVTSINGERVETTHELVRDVSAVIPGTVAHLHVRRGSDGRRSLRCGRQATGGHRRVAGPRSMNHQPPAYVLETLK